MAYDDDDKEVAADVLEEGLGDETADDEDEDAPEVEPEEKDWE